MVIDFNNVKEALRENLMELVVTFDTVKKESGTAIELLYLVNPDKKSVISYFFQNKSLEYKQAVSKALEIKNKMKNGNLIDLISHSTDNHSEVEKALDFFKQDFIDFWHNYTIEKDEYIEAKKEISKTMDKFYSQSTISEIENFIIKISHIIPDSTIELARKHKLTLSQVPRGLTEKGHIRRFLVDIIEESKRR